MADSKEKILGQFKLRVTGTLGVFDAYGLGVYIPEATNSIAMFAIEMHKRLLDIYVKESKSG